MSEIDSFDLSKRRIDYARSIYYVQVLMEAHAVNIQAFTDTVKWMKDTPSKTNNVLLSAWRGGLSVVLRPADCSRRDWDSSTEWKERDEHVAKSSDRAQSTSRTDVRLDDRREFLNCLLDLRTSIGASGL